MVIISAWHCLLDVSAKARLTEHRCVVRECQDWIAKQKRIHTNLHYISTEHGYSWSQACLPDTICTWRGDWTCQMARLSNLPTANKLLGCSCLCNPPLNQHWKDSANTFGQHCASHFLFCHVTAWFAFSELNWSNSHGRCGTVPPMVSCFASHWKGVPSVT